MLHLLAKMTCMLTPMLYCQRLALAEIWLSLELLGGVKLLYKTPTASILTNSPVSANIELTRGTAQGSPLSPLVFAPSIERRSTAI